MHTLWLPASPRRTPILLAFVGALLLHAAAVGLAGSGETVVAGPPATFPRSFVT